MKTPQIQILSIDGFDVITPLLNSSAFKPLRYLKKEPDVDLSAFWFRYLRDLLQLPNTYGLLAIHRGTPQGLLIYSDNPWETNLLGNKAAVINAFIVDSSTLNKDQVALYLLDHALQDAFANGVQFILGKTYSDELTTIHALESRGFLLMDTIVDCIYDYRCQNLARIAPHALTENITLRLATPHDRDELVDVASIAFSKHFGRFHADEQIGHKLATQAYEQWMHSCLDGYADWIHLALFAGRIVGFSIWKRPSKAENTLKVHVAHYSIAGIHPDFHGLGLFTALTYAGMQSLEGIADIIEGPTHINNYAVQKGYSKLGWQVICDARHSFHKWMNK